MVHHPLIVQLLCTLQVNGIFFEGIIVICHPTLVSLQCILVVFHHDHTWLVFCLLSASWPLMNLWNSSVAGIGSSGSIDIDLICTRWIHVTICFYTSLNCRISCITWPVWCFCDYMRITLLFASSICCKCFLSLSETNLVFASEIIHLGWPYFVKRDL